MERKEDTTLEVLKCSSDDSEKGSDWLPPNLQLDEKTQQDVREVISTINIEDAVSYLRSFIVSHNLDSHLSTAMMDEIAQLLDDLDNNRQGDKSYDVVKRLKAYYYVFDFHSPYTEVRASVLNTDDPTLPVDTFRAWFLGILFTVLFSSLNQFFSLRFPRIAIDSVCIQVLSYPCGKAMERLLPTRKFQVLGYSFSLNPGPFNQKEHMLITVMANLCVANIYSTWIFEVQILKKFFDQPWARNKAYQYCITISMQCMGYGLAGLARSCIVFPDYCIWPYNLATVVLNRALHEKSSGARFRFLKVTFNRYRYFLALTGAYFVWHMIGPGFLFGGSLDNFNWITWIKPQSKTLALITGGNNGLGLNPWPTWDWNRAAQFIDPLVAPWFTMTNTFFGVLIVGLFFNLPIYLTNVWYSGHLPFNTNKSYDRYGKPFRVRDVIDDRGNLVLEKYKAYSPMYATGCYAVKFMFFFAAYTASVSHALLWHHHQIWFGLKSIFSRKLRLEQQNDVHNRLMRRYPEAPQWWYAALFIISFVLAAVALAKWLPEAPIWLLIFASGLSTILLIPLGTIDAIAGIQITLNVISELVGGFVVPGKAIPMNMFKAYGCMCLISAIRFSGDLKLGHYLKVPPRSMFRAQLVATLLSIITSLSVMGWQLDNIPNICEDDQKQKFICMSTQTFFTSSIIWGTLGPARMYGPKGIYHITIYGFLAGAFLPIPIYILTKWRYPALRHVYTPGLLMGGLHWAPGNVGFVLPGLYLGYLFNVYIKRRFFPWWATYNYLTSCAMSLGAAIAAIFAFFALGYHGIELDWWGNSVSGAGVDKKGYSWFPIPEEGFGPGPGEFE